MYCWYCHWGWPKQIADIYDEALEKLDGDERPLHYGPAHIVWEDENFDDHWVKFCIEQCSEMDLGIAITADQVPIVRESLEKLLLVPDQYKHNPGGEPADNPPPADWIMVKR